MTDWQEILILALTVFALVTVISALRKNRRRKDLEFNRKLETILQPRESVKLICPQKYGSCILTSKRLLFERSGTFTAVPLKDIDSLRGLNTLGNRTTAIEKMVCLTVRAEKDYIIRNVSPEFPELAARLTETVRKQNEKKKAKQAAKKQTGGK